MIFRYCAYAVVGVIMFCIGITAALLVGVPERRFVRYKVSSQKPARTFTTIRYPSLRTMHDFRKIMQCDGVGRPTSKVAWNGNLQYVASCESGNAYLRVRKFVGNRLLEDYGLSDLSIDGVVDTGALTDFSDSNRIQMYFGKDIGYAEFQNQFTKGVEFITE